MQHRTDHRQVIMSAWCSVWAFNSNEIIDCCITRTKLLCSLYWGKMFTHLMISLIIALIWIENRGSYWRAPQDMNCLTEWIEIKHLARPPVQVEDPRLTSAWIIKPMSLKTTLYFHFTFFFPLSVKTMKWKKYVLLLGQRSAWCLQSHFHSQINTRQHR